MKHRELTVQKAAPVCQVQQGFDQPVDCHLVAYKRAKLDA